MSKPLLVIAQDFASRKISVDEFVDEFIKQRRTEGQDGTCLKDSFQLGEALSTIFCLADLYNPDSDRKEYELDEENLRDKVSGILIRLEPLGDA